VGWPVTLDRSGGVVGSPTKSQANRVVLEDREFAVSAEGLRLLRDDVEQRRQFVACALSFHAWLDAWQFVREGQPPRLLGPSL
jgi:hypothetical protein